MAAYFLDSSACVKLYVAEEGTVWMRGLTEAFRRHELFIIRVAVVETAAALYRRAHLLTNDFDEARAGFLSLQRDVQTLFRVIEVSPNVVSLALDVAVRRGLRGYDCLQLAGALLAQQARVTVGLSNMFLVSADVELTLAASAEGFEVENPNEH